MSVSGFSGWESEGERCWLAVAASRTASGTRSVFELTVVSRVDPATEERVRGWGGTGLASSGTGSADCDAAAVTVGGGGGGGFDFPSFCRRSSAAAGASPSAARLLKRFSISELSSFLSAKSPTAPAGLFFTRWPAHTFSVAWLLEAPAAGVTAGVAVMDGVAVRPASGCSPDPDVAVSAHVPSSSLGATDNRPGS